jgi:hypothetical protein
MKLGIHAIQRLDFATTNNHLHVPLTPQCSNEINGRWWSYTSWWKTIFIYYLLDDKHTSYCMTLVSFCIKFSHENFAIGLQGGTSLMSLQASWETIIFFFFKTWTKIWFQVYLFLLSLHFCDVAQCLFDIAWWIWCYPISIIASSRLLDIFLTCFWHSCHLLTFSHHSSEFSQCRWTPLMALLYAFQKFLNVVRCPPTSPWCCPISSCHPLVFSQPPSLLRK